jgi:hypothetical protein
MRATTMIRLFDSLITLRAEQALGAADPEDPFDSWPPQIGWWLNDGEARSADSVRGRGKNHRRLNQ